LRSHETQRKRPSATALTIRAMQKERPHIVIYPSNFGLCAFVAIISSLRRMFYARTVDISSSVGGRTLPCLSHGAASSCRHFFALIWLCFSSSRFQPDDDECHASLPALLNNYRLFYFLRRAEHSGRMRVHRLVAETCAARAGSGRGLTFVSFVCSLSRKDGGSL
jgi:hypothetical protein